MEVLKKEAALLREAIKSWHSNHIIDQKTAEAMEADLQIKNMDWQRIAKFAFWFAIGSILVAFAQVIADEKVIVFLSQIFLFPTFAASLIFALLAGLSIWIANRRGQNQSIRGYSSEAINLIGVIAFAVSINYFGEAMQWGTEYYSLIGLSASLIYFGIAVLVGSKLVCLFAIIALAGWLGMGTGYSSGLGGYFFGMNIPLRFVFFAIALLGVSRLLRKTNNLSGFYSVTRSSGLFYLFMALWLLSIFGNYGDLNEWVEAKQVELLHWSIVFGMASLLSIFIGVKTDDAAYRGFGVVFLLINLYTRFFEYFWDTTNKAIFFSLLAASFWALGKYADKIWLLSEKRE